MDLTEFKKSLENDHAPDSGSDYLLALWYDGKGDWDTSHRIVQDIPTIEASWIHAYLHRKEGDEWNAGYWYRRAGQAHCKTSLDEEWNRLAEFFLRDIS